MSRAFHEACNTALRTAMADLIGKPQGGWVLLGCITTDGRTRWMHLAGLTGALQAAFDNRAAAEEVTYASIFDAAADLAEDLPPDAAPSDDGELCGIALVCNIDDSGEGRVCIADAVFDDAWAHTVFWKAKKAAPNWRVLAPPEQRVGQSSGRRELSALLAAVLTEAGQGSRLVGLDQVELTVALAERLEEWMDAGLHMVFVIVRTRAGWEALPAPDLAKRVGAKVRAGAQPLEALRALSAELEANPPVPILDFAGVGTVVHDLDDGSVAAGQYADSSMITAHLVALTDTAIHSGAWVHGEARPDWLIHPRAALDAEFAPVGTAYAALLEALRGNSSS